MAEELNIPIAQVIRNYTANLSVFPPQDPALWALHQFMRGFYAGFIPAAQAVGIVEGDQGRALEYAQKTLWAFARFGRLESQAEGPALVLDRQLVQAHLKYPRAEGIFNVLARLGLPVEYCVDGAWLASGKLKSSEALRLRFSLAPVLQTLAAQACAGRKEKPAFELFLRANPQAVLARDKPALDLAPDDPAILANLPAAVAQAWHMLVRSLADVDGYFPEVEFRSIHHGMWAVNYNSRRGGRDLCGLTVQNGEMTVRIILYRAGHFYVKDRLEEFGSVIADAFHNAYYYEEFLHQWLFVPVRDPADLEGIQKLLALQPELLKEK